MVKARSRKQLKRTNPSKDPRDRILIVCEGSKSEPEYLEDLKNFHRLTATNITVDGTGLDPGSIVKRAKRIQDKERLKHDKYDQVFCVFDRDEHATFATACNEARSSGFSPVCSWPCFEYWILLHFRYSRSPYGRTGDKSPADNCISDLMQVFPSNSR